MSTDQETINALRTKLEALRIATDCDAAELDHWKARCLLAEERLAAAEGLLAEALPILKPDAPLRWYVNDAVRDRIRNFLSPKEQ